MLEKKRAELLEKKAEEERVRRDNDASITVTAAVTNLEKKRQSLQGYVSLSVSEECADERIHSL